MPVFTTALQLSKLRLIACFTESGDTPFWVSRVRGNVPILGLSRTQTTLATMALWRGVIASYFDITKYEPAQIPAEVVRIAKSCLKDLQVGDRIIITRGDKKGVSGSGTNRMHILEIDQTLFATSTNTTP